MNRRNFFSTVAKAAVAFSILPAATTYSRLWKPNTKLIVHPDWISAPYEVYFSIMAYPFNEFRQFPEIPVVCARRYEIVNGIYKEIEKYIYA